MRRRPRFLLCSYNYEPEPTGIGAYTTTMARYLHLAHGWDVQVFTGIPHYPWWHVHPDYASRDFRRGRADETLGGVTVHRLPHFVPDGPPGGLARIRLDLSWLIALALRLARERRRPDYCFFVAPPFLAGVLARALARWWRVPVQYHVQDLQVDAAADLGMLPRPLCAAMLAIERDNDRLRGVLPTGYANPTLDQSRLGQVVDLIGSIGFTDLEADRDILGRVYEYFLLKFDMAYGRAAGEFYTPRDVVQLLVEMVEPYEGRVYDP
ncbi:MAG: N-6 DNA methylase, partial [Planctomycetota bacterium]